MDAIEKIRKDKQNTFSELKQMYYQSDKKAEELIESGFQLELEWIDKIITLSVSIISLTITILLAMRNNNQPLSLGFFWMWLFLALSAGFCLLSRFSYSKLKFAQGKQVRIFQEKIRNTYYDIANKESDEEIGVDFLDSNKVDVIDPSSSNTKIWSELSCCSSRIGIVFFVLGIVVFIYIGAELVF